MVGSSTVCRMGAPEHNKAHFSGVEKYVQYILYLDIQYIFWKQLQQTIDNELLHTDICFEYFPKSKNPYSELKGGDEPVRWMILRGMVE